jgi:aryl-alcohol dehydrogenase-like predicted oxidoreductase
MKLRELGKTGEYVSVVGLGCMGMSTAYGKADETECLATLRRALELGVNFWDTADVYGNGANEELISRVLRDNRDNVFIATKFGFRTKDGGDTFKGAEIYVDASPKWMREAVEGSLRRLKIDAIDLYYAHRIDPNVPIEETVGAMSKLVKEGKVRYLGLSECTPEDLKKAHAVHPITAVQSEYSLLTRGVESSILPLTKELGITFVPFAPLSRALLTNTLKLDAIDGSDFRSRSPRFGGLHGENNAKLAAAFAGIAEKKGVTPAQLALAWIFAKGDNIIPIPGSKSRAHLDENTGAVSVALTADDVAEIEHLTEQYPNIGPRYGAREEKFVKKQTGALA